MALAAEGNTQDTFQLSSQAKLLHFFSLCFAFVNRTNMSKALNGNALGLKFLIKTFDVRTLN
jgi:hypothetical protein